MSVEVQKMFSQMGRKKSACNKREFAGSQLEQLLTGELKQDALDMSL